MLDGIKSIIASLKASRPARVLAISDYGAQHSKGTGMAMLFHEMEARLSELNLDLLLLRSAEHMENWARMLGIAKRTLHLPSMHHEITKRFPTVSARDLGRIAGAEMLEVWPKGRRIIHVEGPKRFSAEDVAAAFSSLLGLDVQAVALPRAQWMSTLHASGIEQNTARCLVEFFDTCNSGIIDIHRDGKIRLGRTELASALEHVFACSLLESNAVMGEKSKLIPAAHAERARIKDER